MKQNAGQENKGKDSRKNLESVQILELITSALFMQRNQKKMATREDLSTKNMKPKDEA